VKIVAMHVTTLHITKETPRYSDRPVVVKYQSHAHPGNEFTSFSEVGISAIHFDKIPQGNVTFSTALVKKAVDIIPSGGISSSLSMLGNHRKSACQAEHHDCDLFHL
jgi:hypothetical protein